jgi:pimeloyl-ACP methyl ester carboxylesterase
MPMVKVNDINIYYESHGKGEALILISQPGSDSSEWKMHIPVFSKAYRVIAFDNRGSGRSDKPDMPYSIEMEADDTVGLMDALGVEKAHVLGVSGAGAIAQNVAYKYPERVKGLILLATMLKMPAKNIFVVDALAKLMNEECSQESLIRAMWPWVLSNRFFENPAIVEVAIKASLANSNPMPAYVFARQSAALTDFDSRPWAGRITAPTLVLAGEDDVSLPMHYSRELAEAIPGAKFVSMSGGHMFNAENPIVFQNAVMEFLEAVI